MNDNNVVYALLENARSYSDNLLFAFYTSLFILISQSNQLIISGAFKKNIIFPRSLLRKKKLVVLGIFIWLESPDRENK